MNLPITPGVTGIKNDEPLPAKLISGIIYGDPGVGKTSLASTCNKPFILDFDDGIDRAGGTFAAGTVERPFTMKVSVYGEFTKVVNKYFADQVTQHGYKTVVIDTGGTLLDNHIAPWLVSQSSSNGNNTGGLSQQGWGALKNEFNRLLIQLKNMGLDILIICHAVEKEKKVSLNVKGGSKGVLRESSEFIGYMQVSGTTRKILFNPSDNRIGKNTAQLPDLDVPDFKEPEFADFMARIFAETKKRMQSMTIAQKEAIKLQKKIVKEIGEAQTDDEIADILTAHADLSPTYQAVLSKTANEKLSAMYAAASFKNLKTVADFNGAVAQLKADFPDDSERPIMILSFKALIDLAAGKGVGYNKEKKVFVQAKAIPSNDA